MGLFKSITNTVTKPVKKATGKIVGTVTGGTITGPIGTSLGYVLGSQYDQNKAQAAAEANIPYAPKPIYPEFKSLLDSGGQLGSQYQLNANKLGLDQIRDQATRSGNSPWASMMLAKEAANLADARGNIGALNSAQQTMAAREMGMKGGLRQSDLVGLQARGNRMANAASQNMGNTAALGRNSILTQDVANKQNAMASLPGLELQALKPQQFNIDAVLKEKRAHNIADLSKFQTEMGAWAGQQQSNAISNSGKK